MYEHHPGNSLAHSASFLGVHNADANEVSAKEKFVHNQTSLNKYSKLTGIETIHRKESDAGKPELQEKLNEFEQVVAGREVVEKFTTTNEPWLKVLEKSVVNTDLKNESDIRKLVGRDGFEPSTNGLKVHCSTD